MRKIMPSFREHRCPCGNRIMPGNLAEFRLGSRRFGCRCLDCFLDSPEVWRIFKRKQMSSYKKMLKRYKNFQKEAEEKDKPLGVNLVGSEGNIGGKASF